MFAGQYFKYPCVLDAVLYYNRDALVHTAHEHFLGNRRICLAPFTRRTLTVSSSDPTHFLMPFF